MGEYLWPGLVAALVLGFAGWRFTKCWAARRRAWAAWLGVHSVLTRRREAALELVAAMRVFRPRDSAALARLETAAAQAKDAERGGPDERSEVEARFDEALAKLPTLVESDALLRIHPGCRRAVEKLAGVDGELKTVVESYNQTVREYELQAGAFPNNVVLHVIDVSPPIAWGAKTKDAGPSGPGIGERRTSAP